MRLICILVQTALILAIFSRPLSAQPQAPYKSATDLFTYFTPGNPGNPIGADAARRGVLHLDDHGTAFIIRTFLDGTPDSNKVCVCLTGHQALHNNPASSPYFNIHKMPWNGDIWMNDLGRESTDVNGRTLNSRIPGASKSTLPSWTILDYKYTPYQYAASMENENSKDAVLVWIDKQYLPTAEYYMLGYDFTDNQQSWNIPGYILGHPLGYPMRIADSLDLLQINTNKVTTASRAPYATASGFSGSPYIARSTSSIDPATVRGIMAGSSYAYQFNDYPIPYQSAKSYDYGFKQNIAKISLLEAAIRKHCWSKQDSASISSSGRYKISIPAYNATVSRYNHNQNIADLTSLLSLSLFVAYNTDHTISTLAQGDVLTVGSNSTADLSFPTVYPGQNKDWEINMLGKEVVINSRFSYTASGDAVLNIGSVVIGSPLSTISASEGIIPPATRNTATTSISSGAFELYPNPSPDGVYHLRVRANPGKPTERYKVLLYTTDGRAVQEAGDLNLAEPYTFSLSGMPHGNYVIVVYDSANRKVFSELLVY